MRKNTTPRALVYALFAFAFASTALATSLPQTFVSASGSDSNPCTQASPCATFQVAINVTTPGGEVDALSAGNFGAFTISHAITIDGKGLGTVGVSSATNAITVNVGSTDTVVLRNLSVNGGGGSGGNGIAFTGGGALLVDGCSISGFTDYAIGDITIGANLTVRNTNLGGSRAYMNAGHGFVVMERVSIASGYGVEENASGANIILSDSVITGSGLGFNVDQSSFGGAITMIERSTLVGDIYSGVYVGAGVTNIDSSTFIGNNVAIQADTSAVIRLSNNNVYNNLTGLDCSGGYGVIDSAGNNRKGSNAGGSAPVCAAIGPITMQ